jgi:hypothetical protein
MEYFQFVIGFFGGLAGALAIVGFLARRWIDHRLNKSLEKYKFLLTNRASACSAILLWVGKVITAVRNLTQEFADTEAARKDLLQATLELEDCLRPAYFLLDEEVYKQVHEYKTAAQSLHKDSLMGAADPDTIDNLVATLEARRVSITSALHGMMAKLQ